MKIFLAILKWSIRIAVVICGLICKNLGSIMLTLILEVALSALSIVRVTPDQIIAVITGFDGNGDQGYYELQENGGVRFFGFLCLIGAYVFRVFLCIYLFSGGTNLIINFVMF